MQAFGLCPTGIMQLSSRIPNKGESHLNLSQFTFLVQMFLCWTFKTIFMLIQMLSKWLKDMQLVHCQQHWRSFFAKIRGTIGQMHDHILWKAPCGGGKMEKGKKKKVGRFHLWRASFGARDALTERSAISVKISCSSAARYIDFNAHKVGWIPTV